MSMEQAILEHASALRELSAAIKSMYAGRAGALAIGLDLGGASDTSVVTAENKASIKNGGREMGADEAAALRKGNAERAEVKPDAELEKAVSKVEKDAKPEAKKPEEKTVTQTEPSQDDGQGSDDGLTELSYTADVRPVLLKLNKAKGADTLKALLKKFGAATGDKLTADQFVAVLADANAQLAA